MKDFFAEQDSTFKTTLSGDTAQLDAALEKDEEIIPVEFGKQSYTFDASYGEGAIPFTSEFGEIQRIIDAGDLPVYEGPHEVEPTFDRQLLQTKNKTLFDDITVNAIRVERVDNSHGTTVYIGTKGD